MSNDNGPTPPQGYRPPAYPGAPVPPQQPAYPTAASVPQPTTAPGYPGAAPQQPSSGYPGAVPPAPAYPGAVPTTPGYPVAGYAQPSYAQPYGQPYPTPQRSNGLAVASLICGIAGLVIIPFLASVAAVITGHLGLNQTKRDSTLGGRGMAIAGLVLGYIGIAFSILLGALMLLAVFAAGSAGYSSY